MWLTIAENEIRSALRDKIIVLLVVILWLLLLVAAFGGYKNYVASQTNRDEAAQLFRQEWEEQEANPHSAAHFGTYLFKPFTFLGLYDTGLNNYTGVSYRVEAHKQHEVNYSTAQERDAYFRFGELTVALVFQVLVPLLVIFLCFSSVVKEKETNTLKMLLSQGLKPCELVWGKVLGNYLIVLAVTMPVLIGMLIGLSLNTSGDNLLPRLLAFIATYLIYFFIITGLVVSISALSKSSGASLLSNLGVWILFCILIPKISAGITDSAYKLPSRYEFNSNVLKGYTSGLKGDKGMYDRYKDYEKAMLAKYKVDSTSQLPFNLTGLAMQAGEDYNTKVYKIYTSEVEVKIKKQQLLQDLFGFIDPLIAVRQLSMGYSGTDFLHHLDFHSKAQQYRNEFIRKLNMQLAYHKPNIEKGAYKEGSSFFKSLKDFSYQLPSLTWVFKSHLFSLSALFFWLFLVVLIIKPVSKRISVL